MTAILPMERPVAVPANNARAIRRPRVLLADDHQMLVDALKNLLEHSFEVVGTVNNGRALLEAASALQPDVIVLDIAMPQLNGLDAARRVKRITPDAKLVFLTMHEDPYLAEEAFRAGASAFLLKQAAAFELTDAIEKVLKGDSYLTPLSANGQDENLLMKPKAHEKAAELTLRQREVVQLLAEGHYMKEVAGILNITKRTVAHKYNSMKLLQLKTNAELVQYALKHKIISL
jgi:DNA-binding NarL/FixJ family response regulator